MEIGTNRRSGESSADFPRTMEFQTHGFFRATGIVSPKNLRKCPRYDFGFREIMTSEGSPMVKSLAVLCCMTVLACATANAQSRPAAKGPVPQQPPAARASVPVRPAGATRNDEPAAPGDSEKQAVVEVKGGVPERRLPVMNAELQAQMDGVLEKWSKASEQITRLEGNVTRMVYDLTFETESQARGEFAYEKPDKGRIDITPEAITDKLIAEREQLVEKAILEKKPPRVRCRKDGKPFQLVTCQSEQWWCDGTRIFSIDLQKKQALVSQIPVEMQGGNIMDSPLPFLFGMPPERAKRRFEMGFHEGRFDSKAPVVRLVIYPNLPQDGQNWHHADVMLDMKTMLPVAVQMYDPAETRITVYRFSDLQINETLFQKLIFRSGFTPSLRGYNIVTVSPENGGVPENGGGAGAEVAGGPVAPGTVPDLKGVSFKAAVAALEELGLKRHKDPQLSQVSLLEGSPASEKEQIYTVESQSPQAGSPIMPGTKVTLKLFTDPARTKTAEKKGDTATR